MTPSAAKNAAYPVAQRNAGHSSEWTPFNEPEFWSMVRRLSGHQAEMRVSDRAFSLMHPGVGSPTTWRLLKILAEEKKVDLKQWRDRIKRECDVLEISGVKWRETAARLPDNEQAWRLECQELVAKLETWRQARDMSQSEFTRTFRVHTGDAATWIRMRKGKWQLLDLKKRLCLLRDLSSKLL